MEAKTVTHRQASGWALEFSWREAGGIIWTNKGSQEHDGGENHRESWLELVGAHGLCSDSEDPIWDQTWDWFDLLGLLLAVPLWIEFLVPISCDRIPCSALIRVGGSWSFLRLLCHTLFTTQRRPYPSKE